MRPSLLLLNEHFQVVTNHATVDDCSSVGQITGKIRTTPVDTHVGSWLSAVIGFSYVIWFSVLLGFFSMRIFQLGCIKRKETVDA